MNKFILSIASLSPTLALAHDEHGSSLMQNINHILANPEHMWPLSIIAALAVVVTVMKVRF